MPFRENDDASRARAEALEQQVEELKEERDALVREKEKHYAKPEPEPEPEPAKAEAKADEKKSEPSPPPSSTSTRPSVVSKIFAVVLVSAVAFGIYKVVVRDRERTRARDDHRAAIAARNSAKERWTALTSVEPCVRSSTLQAAYALDLGRRTAVQKGEGWSQASSIVGGLPAQCTDQGVALLKAKETAPIAKMPLQHWIDAEAALVDPSKKVAAYYSNRDFKEDGFAAAPGLWSVLEVAVTKREAAFADVRENALPQLRADIRELARKEEATAGKTDVVWRIELGLMQWEVGEAWLRASGAYEGKTPDPTAASHAATPFVKALVERAKDAPIEVRRELRRYDFVTSKLLAGGVAPIEWLENMTRDGDLMRGIKAPPAMPTLPPEPPVDGD